MDEAIERAFRAAHYTVSDAGRSWRLTLDCASADLARLLLRHACREAVLITAANPGARRLPEAENARRNARLRSRIDALGLASLDASSSDAAGDWREPGLLCLGLDLASALALGRAFGQLAILHADADAVPRLIPC